MRQPRPQIDLREIDDSLKQRMRDLLEGKDAGAEEATFWAAPFRAAGGKHATM